MATTKLNLPTISGNMSADVVRDMNALAEAVDAKAGVASGLATLGADGKVPASQLNVSSSADKITVADANNHFTGTNVEAVLDELFTFASNGKTSIANAAGSPSLPSDTFTKIANDITTGKAGIASAIRNKGGSVSDDASLGTMAQAVDGIALGKRDLTGTSVADANGTIAVTGLPFRPSLVSLRDITQSNPYTVTAHYSELSKIGALADINHAVSTSNSFGQNTFTISDNGFTFTYLNFQNRTLKWRVVE